jgi:hypothetical protein
MIADIQSRHPDTVCRVSSITAFRSIPWTYVGIGHRQAMGSTVRYFAGQDRIEWLADALKSGRVP